MPFTLGLILWPLMKNLCTVGSFRDYSDLSSLKHRYMTEFSLHCQQHLLFTTNSMDKWSQNFRLCQLLQAASSLSFSLIIFSILWPWPPLYCRNIWVYICLKGVALLKRVSKQPLTELISFSIWSIFVTSRGSFAIDLEHTGGTRCRPAS